MQGEKPNWTQIAKDLYGVVDDQGDRVATWLADLYAARQLNLFMDGIWRIYRPASADDK